jgi:hypothetical protein
MTMRIIKESANAKVLVITPLLPEHKISKETKKTIKRNKVPFVWISYEGSDNIPTNVQNGLNEFRKYKKGDIPEFLLPLDRDIVLGRGMIDKLCISLNMLPPEVAYVYANFEFKGAVNRKFPAQTFDINKLVFNNYISSNSLIRTKALRDIGGFVTDDKYKRLLDWALWLKFYQNGYIGMPCPIANFIAVSSEDDISAGTEEDFELKRRRVMSDFVKPIVERAKEEIQKNEQVEDSSNVLSFDDVID